MAVFALASDCSAATRAALTASQAGALRSAIRALSSNCSATWCAATAASSTARAPQAAATFLAAAFASAASFSLVACMAFNLSRSSATSSGGVPFGAAGGGAGVCWGVDVGVSRARAGGPLMDSCGAAAAVVTGAASARAASDGFAVVPAAPVGRSGGPFAVVLALSGGAGAVGGGAEFANVNVPP